MKPLIHYIILSLLLCFSTSCGAVNRYPTDTITSINIIDRNGMSETISSKERLAQFSKIDFLSAQPYQKVLRVYARDREGNRRSSITSYHPNGQLKQCLEARNNRAYGPYLEYYANGQKKIESFIIGGIADINTQSEQSWLFHKVSRAWDEEGHLLAEILYEKGVLEGTSLYYHSTGALWKELPYKNNQLEGIVSVYLRDGKIFQRAHYKAGLLDGETSRYWDNGQNAYIEYFEKGKLLEASYYSKEGILISKIEQGNGFKAIFGKEHLEELHQYQNGLQEGVVQIFNENKQLIRLYSLKNNEKEGEEIDYFTFGEKRLPKLMITWKEGVMQGVVQSWYPNGQLESRREMSQNRKNGLATYWYQTGSVMSVEEYDNDTLVKGEYYRMNEKEPASLVKKGQGIALLFDAQGTLTQKIIYQDGRPNL